MYRLLVLDLDGTLLNHERIITPRTQQAIARARAGGLTVMIATGQTRDAMRFLCAPLQLSGPQILYNGALITDLQTGEILYENLLPEEYILEGLEVFKTTGLYRVYHTHDFVYADSGTPGAKEWYLPPVPAAIEIPDVVARYPEPCIKIAAVGKPEQISRHRAMIMQHFAGKLYVTQTASDLLELLHPLVSKGQALRTVSAKLGIAPAEIIAIGDNHNDIGMLKFAGLGIAMGNAPAEVKAVADYVTSSNREDGVAAAIETFVLREAAYQQHKGG